MVDKEVETPIHFIEKNLDPNYCWNEWTLRKKLYKWLILGKDKLKLVKLFYPILK